MSLPGNLVNAAGRTGQPRARARTRLVTVAELASWWWVEPSYVYEHAVELGALRLGSGPKAGGGFLLVTVPETSRTTQRAVAVSPY